MNPVTYLAKLHHELAEASYIGVILSIGFALSIVYIFGGSIPFLSKTTSLAIIGGITVAGGFTIPRLPAVNALTKVFLMFLVSTTLFSLLVITLPGIWTTTATVAIVLLFGGTLVNFASMQLGLQAGAAASDESGDLGMNVSYGLAALLGPAVVWVISSLH